jgi:hypothetical protein
VIFADADRAGHQFPFALRSLEVVLINHYAYAPAAFVLKAADNAAMAIDLYIVTGSNYIAGKQNGEVHQRSNWNVTVHGEEHAIGGYILRLRRTRTALRFQLHRQMQGKARRTLHFCIMLNRSLLRRFRYFLFARRFA